jgi:hypothetical protein
MHEIVIDKAPRRRAKGEENEIQQSLDSFFIDLLLLFVSLSVQFNLFISLFTLNSIDKLDERKVVVLSLSAAIALICS